MTRNKLNVKNIIKVKEEEVVLKKSDEKLEVTLSDKLDFYDIIKLNIEVKEDTSLCIEYVGKKEIKLDISITVNPNVTFTIKEKRLNASGKIQTKYFIYDKACVNLEKFYDVDSLKELNIAYLNGVEASFISKVKGIVKGDVKLDQLIYHNFPKTIGNVSHDFVTIQEGNIKLNVTSLIYHNRIKCEAHQYNHIIQQNQLMSWIKPNLLIEENDVEASHSANVEPFNQDALFFMKARGIEETLATKLLLKGFLENEIVEVDPYIEKYWG